MRTYIASMKPQNYEVPPHLPSTAIPQCIECMNILAVLIRSRRFLSIGHNDIIHGGDERSMKVHILKSLAEMLSLLSLDEKNPAV